MIEAEKIGGIPKNATQTVQRGLQTFQVVSDRTTPQDLRGKGRPPVQTGYTVIKVGNRDFFVPPPVRGNIREISIPPSEPSLFSGVPASDRLASEEVEIATARALAADAQRVVAQPAEPRISEPEEEIHPPLKVKAFMYGKQILVGQEDELPPATVVPVQSTPEPEAEKRGREAIKSAQAVQDYINRLEQALGTSVSARGWRERLNFLKNDPMAQAVLGEIALSYGGTAAQLGGTALAILSKRFGPWGLIAGEVGELLIGKLHREHTVMNENEIMAYNIAVRDTLAVFLGRDINDPALDGILMKVLNPRNLAQASHNVTPVTRSAAKLASKKHGQQ